MFLAYRVFLTSNGKGSGPSVTVILIKSQMRNISIQKLGLTLGLFFLLNTSQGQQLDWVFENPISRSWGSDVTVNNDGDVYFAGSYSANTDGALLQKYSASGVLLWEDQYFVNGGVRNEYIVLDSLSNAYLVFQSYNNDNMYILKYSSSGQRIWAKGWGNQYTPYSIKINSKGFIYVVGFHTNYQPGFICKFNTSGDCVSNVFIEKGCFDLCIDSQDNLYTSHQDKITKRDSLGNILWTYNYFTWGNWERRIALDKADNCYYTCGLTGCQNILFKLNKYGQNVWSLTMTSGESGNGIHVDPLGNIYTTGSDCTWSPSEWLGIGVAKFDTHGNQLWYMLIPQPQSANYWYNSTGIAVGNGGVYVCGNLEQQYDRALLFKLNEPKTPFIYEPVSDDLLILSPGLGDLYDLSYRSISKQKISIMICDISGKLIIKSEYSSFNGELNEIFDLSDYSSGIYFLTLVQGESKRTKKILIN
jgi:hypothetical protein